MRTEAQDVLPAQELGSEVLAAVRDESLLVNASLLGFTSLMRFSKAEYIPIADFKERAKEILADTGKVTVFRDTGCEKAGVLFDDFAVVFDITSVSDINAEILTTHLKTQDALEVSPSTGKFKLIYWKQRADGELDVTLEIPPSQFTYHSTYHTAHDWRTTPIWHPTLWFRLVLSSALSLRYAHIAVVCNDALRSEDAKLGKLLLPNNGSKGRICYGHTSTQHTYKTDPPTVGEIAYVLYLQYVNSTFNADLFNPSAVRAMLNTAGLRYQTRGNENEVEPLLEALQNRATACTLPWPSMSQSSFLSTEW